jgi:hypothetical protein
LEEERLIPPGLLWGSPQLGQLKGEDRNSMRLQFLPNQDMWFCVTIHLPQMIVTIIKATHTVEYILENTKE